MSWLERRRVSDRRRNTAPSAAVPISCGRCVATSIFSQAAPKRRLSFDIQRETPSGSDIPRTRHQDVERFMKHYFWSQGRRRPHAILCAKLEDQQAKPAPCLAG